MPIAEIAAAITSVRASLDIVKAMAGLRDDEAFRTKSIELHTTILEALEKSIEAREAYSAQLDRICKLEEEVTGLKAWGAEKEKYELKTVGYSSMAYMLKPDARGPEPPHWLCPNCYQKGQKSFFQPNGERRGRDSVFVCIGCKGTIAAPMELKWID